MMRNGLKIGFVALAFVVLLVSNVVQAASPLLEDEKNTVEVFRRVSPSVVFITTTVRESNLFNFNVMEVPRGSGSGFVWDKQGHIVTNLHVIKGASRLLVTLPGVSESHGTENTVPAKVVGVYPAHDIAVLRIHVPASKLRPVVPGDSNSLQVGQKVLAIGNPFGLDQTLTRGIVSALGRDIESEGSRKIRDMIQTDASINPGNSGGPLLDSSGELIGMNTAIFSPSGASAGIGFAVPVNVVKRVVPQIVANGRVTRVGIGITTVPDALARANDISGIVVAEVGPQAEKAGLQGLSRGSNGQILLGDVIVGVGNVRVKNQDDLLAELDTRKAGDSVVLKVLRGKRERSVSVVLQEIE
jgi:S1-C subfamily serine protease